MTLPNDADSGALGNSYNSLEQQNKAIKDANRSRMLGFDNGGYEYTNVATTQRQTAM